MADTAVRSDRPLSTKSLHVFTQMIFTLLHLVSTAKIQTSRNEKLSNQL